MRNVLITGVSSGLGKGLAEVHLAAGDKVFGVSRRSPSAELTEAGLVYRAVDLAVTDAVAPALDALLDGVDSVDLVYLNAGILGTIEDLGAAELSELKRTLDINLWSNKTVLDALAGRGVAQVVAISSGASQSGSRGWSGYAISKAALNMLVKLYAVERPQTHFTALAPGLIETAMQDHLCGLPEDERFTTVDRLKAARGTDAMPTPRGAAESILAALGSLGRMPSGGYADIRNFGAGATGETGAPLENLDQVLPSEILGIVNRSTPIPSIAKRAAEIRAEHPTLVRADIGQISGFDADLEVLYGPPVGLPRLRELLAESWNLAHGKTPEDGGLGPENVCVTTGAAEGLSLLFRCFAPGKVVGVPRGHWSNYRNGAELAGGRIEVLDFFDDQGALDIAGLVEGIGAAGVEVLVANFPCNPTGAVLTPDEAAALAGMVEELGIVCIADEVYDRLRYDGQPPLSLLPFAPGHMVSVSSASKEYLLPGARVGYVLSAQSRLTDKVLRKLVRANTASPNVLGQRKLIELLERDVAAMRSGDEPPVLSRVRGEMGERRNRLVAVLEKQGMAPKGRANHSPDGTIFLMAGLPEWWDGDDAGFTEAALEAAAVSTVPGSAFGLPGSVRFSYGGMTVEQIEQLDQNLTRMRSA